jgi:hypothetical protein
MRRRAPYALLVALIVGSLAVLTPGPAHAGGPGVWTKIATVDNGFDYPGIFRTSNGTLHVVWRKHPNGKYEYDYSTVSLNGAFLGSGKVLGPWGSLEEDPVLVRNGSGMRLLFKGGQDSNPSNFFGRGSVYTMTSTNGTTWVLPMVSAMKQNVLNNWFSATAEKDDTPVSVAILNATMYVHEGFDANAPAAANDTQITLPSGDYDHPKAVTASDGSVWVGYFRVFSNPSSLDGYYVQQVLPSVQPPKKAPSSHNGNVDNEPRQAVALVARPQGGLFLAYCSPSNTKPCAHVDLWKVGSSTAKVVPGTSSGTITRVALAAGLQGRISVLWGDPLAAAGKGRIGAVRTNKAASALGVVRTIPMPKGWINFDTLEGEGTFGRLDVVGNFQMSAPPNPIELWQTQILPGMTLKASPIKFSHTNATTVTFTATEAGDPIGGVKVTCAGTGKSGVTGSNGIVKITFPKGTATGKHVCSGQRTGYNTGKVTITVTWIGAGPAGARPPGAWFACPACG